MSRVLCVSLIIMSSFAVADAALAAEDARLPFGRAWVGEQDLPEYLGIGLTVFYQNQDYALAGLTVDFPFYDPSMVQDVSIDNNLWEINVKADVWLLPFLNVFGLAGRVDGETKVDLGQPLGLIEVDYDGLVFGAGFTVAGGTDRFFGSLTATYTDTDLDTTESSIHAWVLEPRAGIRFEGGDTLHGLALWGGAMYQSMDEHHTGSMNITGIGPVAFDVELEEKDAWNLLAGVLAEFSKHWHVEGEVGFMNRTHATGSLIYRFSP